MNVEVEIKLWVSDSLPAMRKRITALKFKLHKPRLFEQNLLLDTSDKKLRRSGLMIRIRRVGKLGLVTFKGRTIAGPHKKREELELEVDNPDTMQSILARLGYQPVFRYEKFREEYQRPREHGTITLDETPIGNFLELEGAPRWIDRTARELGFSRNDYITRSYGNLYMAYCREHGTTPGDMVFHQQ